MGLVFLWVSVFVLEVRLKLVDERSAVFTLTTLDDSMRLLRFGDRLNSSNSCSHSDKLSFYRTSGAMFTLLV